MAKLLAYSVSLWLRRVRKVIIIILIVPKKMCYNAKKALLCISKGILKHFKRRNKRFSKGVLSPF